MDASLVSDWRVQVLCPLLPVVPSPRWRGLPMENRLRPPGDLDRSPYGCQDVLL